MYHFLKILQFSLGFFFQFFLTFQKTIEKSCIATLQIRHFIADRDNTPTAPHVTHTRPGADTCARRVHVSADDACWFRGRRVLRFREVYLTNLRLRVLPTEAPGPGSWRDEISYYAIINHGRAVYRGSGTCAYTGIILYGAALRSDGSEQ